MDIAVRLVEHHVWLIGDLIDRADTLDADQDSIRAGLSRLAGKLEIWLAAVEGKEPPEVPPRSIDELRQRHGEVGRRFVELARSVVREERAEDRFWEGSADHPDVLTYGGMIAHVLFSAAAPRAEVVAALRHAGANPPSGDPMLFLIDPAPPR